MRVSEIYIYPVKGFGGISLDGSYVERRGLRYDRRWMVVDGRGTFLTQRSFPKMATIKTEIDAEHLILYSPFSSLAIPIEFEGEAVCVEVWRDKLIAAEVPEAAKWLSEVLETECRLVKMSGESCRPTNPQFSQPGDEVSFADGYPCLIVNDASLGDLNDRLELGLPMNRFRPNLVVTGAGAWEEDGWESLDMGAVSFRVAKPCGRCLVTTIDQETGQPQGNEPLRTLAGFRQVGKALNFGINVIPDGDGYVRLGEEVLVSSIL